MGKIKIGIGIITGRKNFIHVLEANYKDWKKSGFIDNPNISIEVFIAYDLSFSGVEEKEFKKIPKEIINGVDGIVFLGEKQVETITKEIKQENNISIKDSQTIFGTHGYSKLRNTVLYSAIRKNIDYLLFIDDDEYPYAVVQKEDKLEWVTQSTLKVHLENIMNCDVTYGYKCGYVSPIPYFDINQEVDENILKSFIEVMSNDAFNWKELKKLIYCNKGVTYANTNILHATKPREVKLEKGGKWVWGTNLCLNLNKMKNSIPPFYNPPEARGEDTFFSTMLKNKKVLRVPVYSFHDSFQQYTEAMASEKFPNKLIGISKKDHVNERFLKACLGWIRYKPLLTYIVNRENYTKTIKTMNIKLKESILDMCKVLQNNEFAQLEQELHTYNTQVKDHYKEYKHVGNTWKKVLNTMYLPKAEKKERKTKVAKAKKEIMPAI